VSNNWQNSRFTGKCLTHAAKISQANQRTKNKQDCKSFSVKDTIISGKEIKGMKQKITVWIVALFAAVALVGSGSALAAKPSGDTRPGWGFGDGNHVHVGPPGQSVSVAPNYGHHNVFQNIVINIRNFRGTLNLHF
jgi:hypothetical protein